MLQNTQARPRSQRLGNGDAMRLRNLFVPDHQRPILIVFLSIKSLHVPPFNSYSHTSCPNCIFNCIKLSALCRRFIWESLDKQRIRDISFRKIPKLMRVVKLMIYGFSAIISRCVYGRAAVSVEGRCLRALRDPWLVPLSTGGQCRPSFQDCVYGRAGGSPPQNDNNRMLTDRLLPRKKLAPSVIRALQRSDPQ